MIYLCSLNTWLFNVQCSLFIEQYAVREACCFACSQYLKLRDPMATQVDDVAFMFSTQDQRGLLYQLVEGTAPLPTRRRRRQTGSAVAVAAAPKYMRLYLQRGYLVFVNNLNGSIVVRTPRAPVFAIIAECTVLVRVRVLIRTLSRTASSDANSLVA